MRKIAATILFLIFFGLGYASDFMASQDTKQLFVIIAFSAFLLGVYTMIKDNGSSRKQP